MMKPAIIGVIAVWTATILGPLPATAFAQMSMPSEFEERTAQTTSYRIQIRTGPKVTMPMSPMTAVDQGKPVNRHLEVHIFNRSTGAEVKDLVPTVSVNDQATRASHFLTNLMACRISKHRGTEPHFGDNVYLPDGTYTVTVVVAKETAVFKDVVLKTTK